MSAAQFIESIAVFQGAQGKFYLVNGYKYHIRFPMDWAYTHKAFRLPEEVEFNDGSGPEYCGNCAAYGSIRGVFVGYCSNCLKNYIDTNEPRGRLTAPGTSIDMVDNDTIWQEYPYMYGIPKSEIGDEEGVEATDDGISMERLAEAILAAEVDEALDEEEEGDLEEGEVEAVIAGAEEDDEYSQYERNRENDEYWDARRYEYFEDEREREMRIEELEVEEEEETVCDNIHNDIIVISDDETISNDS